MAATVRSLVREMQARIREEADLTPLAAADILARLSALYANILDEIRVAEADYNAVYLQALQGEEAANRAKIRAQSTPQYARFREAKDLEKLALEMIRSLKYLLKTKQEEMRLAR